MPTMTNVMSLQGAQVKIEAERCVAEAVMSRWLYPDTGQQRFQYAQDFDDIPTSSRSFHSHRKFGLGRYHVTFTYTEQMTYEDMVWWLCMILKGGSAQRTGTTTGSTPAGYTYLSTPSSDEDDLDSFTMKFNEPSNIYQVDRVMVQRATFAFDAVSGVNWVMTLDLIARELTPDVEWDAVPDHTTTNILARGTKFFIDEPAGVIGTTQVLAKLRSGSITVDSQIEMKAFSEDADTDACAVGRGEQLVTGEVVLEWTDDEEFAKMRAGTERMLRFQQTGPSIGATPATTHIWQVDIPTAHWMAPTMDYAGQNKIQTFGFTGYSSPTSPQPISTRIVNTLATVTA